MKRLFVVFAVALLASFSWADKIAWDLDVSDATFKTTWNGASVYSYYVLGSDTTVIKSFTDAWSTSYTADESSVWGGSNSTWDSSSAGGSSPKGFSTGSTTGGYLVVILSKGDNAIYSWTDSPYTCEDQASVSADDLSYFDQNGYDNTSAKGGNGGGWAKVDGVVPEPGMLALLALGVAGLALRRKVA